MSERAQELWERKHGKGNPAGGNQSDVEVDENLAIYCEDCDAVIGGTEEDFIEPCGVCGSTVCEDCDKAHGFIGDKSCAQALPAECCGHDHGED